MGEQMRARDKYQNTIHWNRLISKKVVRATLRHVLDQENSVENRCCVRRKWSSDWTSKKKNEANATKVKAREKKMIRKRRRVRMFG